MTRALIAGTVAGVLTFAVQAAIVGPLIAEAEAIEATVSSHQDHDAAEEWAPADGVERTAYTLLGTVLTAIAFGAIMLGVASMLGLELTMRTGLLLGAAGFLSFALAPAFGLPPKPPAVPGAEVSHAQLWWVLTACCTAAGIWMMAQPEAAVWLRAGGLLVIAVPHLIGAPAAAASTVMPESLVRDFAVRSVASQAVMWAALGWCAGLAGQRARHERPLAEFAP